MFKTVIRFFCVSTRQLNMKYLNVAEKNDAAKTIAGYLSRGNSRRREGFSPYNKIYEFEAPVNGQNVTMIMTSVAGHLLGYEFEPSFRGWKTCNPEQLFEAPLRKSCPEQSLNIKRTLEREVRFCSHLIIWTDCDREGENIGFEIIDVCKAIKPNIVVQRAKFSEITSASIHRALNNLIAPDKRQSDAVDVRSELDLRIGAAFTRYQTLRLQNIFPSEIQSLISYGSCQFPTLGFVAHRFMEIENFISQPFWKIKVLHRILDVVVEFQWERNRLFDRNICNAILKVCKQNSTAKVVKVESKPKSKWRPQPMDTVELEKLGSRKLKLSAKQTMTIAEKLYTQGFISYPRTETNIFSKEINLNALVEAHTAHPDWGSFAGKVLSWGPNPRNGKKSDQAHPPIHPTKMTADLRGDEKKVYDLIVRHFLACLSKDAQGLETIVNVVIADEQFTATGLVVLEKNYLEVYPYDKWSGKEIHNYKVGETFEPTELSLHEGATSPPNMLTEADLVALMEKHGIGTDATHAEHINTIKERGYIGETGNGYLIPGELGMGLVEGYDAMALTLTEPKLRADLEKDLKRICEGTKDPKAVLREQIQLYKQAYQVVTEKIKAVDEALGKRFRTTPINTNNDFIPQTETVMPCNKCGGNMVLKQKKNGIGYFLSCQSYPQCKNSKWFNEGVVKQVEVLNESCNRCGSTYKKLHFKFKRSPLLGMLQTDSLEYSGCVSCDTNLLNVLETNSMPSYAPTINRDQPVPRESNNGARNNQNNFQAVTRTNPPPQTTSTGWGLPQNPMSNVNNSNRNRQSGNFPDVKCTKCGQSAKLLKTRKEGPNKDRKFYTCCNGFFKWADEVVMPEQDQQENSGRRTAKRKCGICRQEGHVRSRCPQNQDVD